MPVIITPAQSRAMTTCNIITDEIEYLDEKMVFCLSEKSLRDYEKLIKKLDLNGMNTLVLAGKCNFIPDGQYLPLDDYDVHTNYSAQVISTKVENVTLWTFKKLISKGNPEELATTTADPLHQIVAKNDAIKNNHCR